MGMLLSTIKAFAAQLKDRQNKMSNSIKRGHTFILKKYILSAKTSYYMSIERVVKMTLRTYGLTDGRKDALAHLKTNILRQL